MEQRELVRWLKSMVADPAVADEQRCHVAVIGRIVELKAETAARAIKIVLPYQTPTIDLPEGVSLRPCRLTVARPQISWMNSVNIPANLPQIARLLFSQLSAAFFPIRNEGRLRLGILHLQS